MCFPPVCVYVMIPCVLYVHTCRYTILAPKAVPPGFMDSRKATGLIIEELQLNESEYRMGHSKVFFKAGVLGSLEDLRDERLGKIIGQFQSYCRGYLMRKQYRKLLDQRLAIAVIQRNVRKHLFLRDWQWWRVFTKIRPMLKVVHTEQELKQKDEEVCFLSYTTCICLWCSTYSGTSLLRTLWDLDFSPYYRGVLNSEVT